jgi:HEAT repeat protein
LLALAHKIGDFGKFIGGVEYAPMLIPTLEYLCGADETAVRIAASSSLNKILSQLTQNHKSQAQEFLELFKRLSNDENPDLFYSRISACHMVGELYRISESGDRASIREIYNKLIVDEISLVKRAAASNLILLAKHCEADILANEVFQVLKKMVVDELPTVRSIAAAALIPYAKLLKSHDRMRNVTAEYIPMLHACYDDLSWRIRLAVSKDYQALAECFDASITASDVFPGVIQFLQDVEPDIRKNAIRSLVSFIPVIGAPSFLNEFLPLIPTMLADPVSDVRKLLAEACIDIAVKLTPEQMNANLSDVILRIMSDEDPLVRLRIIQKLPTIAEELPTLCSKLTEIVKSCLLDINWRMRKGIALVLPALVKALGIDYFIEHYQNLFLNILKDSVSEVRYACAEVVPQFIAQQTNKIASCEFVYQQIFPTIKSMGNDEYVVRLSMLTVLEGLLQIKDLPENFRTEVVQLLVNASNDKVANIRLRSAQVMAVVGRCAYPENVKGYIKLILTNLANDKDKDVQYFTSTALQEFP